MTYLTYRRSAIGKQQALAPILFALLLLSAIPSAALAHGVAVPWLQPGAVDPRTGIFVAFDGPHRIRKIGPITLAIRAINVDGQNDCVITAVRVRDPAGNLLHVSTPDFRLLTQARSATELRTTLGVITPTEVVESKQRELAAQLWKSSYRGELRLAEQAVRGLFATTGEVALTSEIEVKGPLETIVLSAVLRLDLTPPLPDGHEPTSAWLLNPVTGTWDSMSEPRSPSSVITSEPYWYAGDQHVHTMYSADTSFPGFCDHDPDSIDEFGQAGITLGLKWIIITDHSNVATYSSSVFQNASSQAALFNAQHPAFRIMYSQEMGVHTAVAANDEPAHLLTYPKPTTNVPTFMSNSCTEGIYGENNCESVSTILARVDQAGYVGFIAHPFKEGQFDLAFDPWDMWSTTGYAGLEVWSNAGNCGPYGIIEPEDNDAIVKWQSLLLGITAPSGGQLALRNGWPNRFPVGLGNSDAHSTTTLANTFTYCWFESSSSPTQSQISSALLGGHCVASNGPLLFGTINGARIGEVAVQYGSDAQLTVQLRTTTEFGHLGLYKLTVVTVGFGNVDRTEYSLGFATNQYSAALAIPGGFNAAIDRFVYLQLDRADDRYHAITNPIWLEFCQGNCMPLKPTNPNPSNGATGQSSNVDIGWSNGGGATSYDVYFGTDSIPDSSEFKGNQTATSYDPGALANSTTYYWRIDARSSAGVTAGVVWSFTTEPGTQPPASDICANATNIGVGTSYGTNVGATTDREASCHLSENDVWWRFCAPSTGVYEVNTMGSTFDTVLSIRTTCGGAEIACNDDNGGPGYWSRVRPTLNAGTCYRIRVGGSEATPDEVGDITLNIVAPPPLGACCVSGNACNTGVTRSWCDGQGGIWQGDGSSGCTDCPPILGACCVGGNTCYGGVPRSWCDGQSGVWQGDGSQGCLNCIPPPVTGACCIDGDTCYGNVTLSWCDSGDGVWQGPGTEACSNCPAGGACCVGGNDCQLGVTQTWCGGQGGAWQGDGSTSCTNCPPPPITGACCLPSGTCLILSNSECTSLSGSYLGNDTQCFPIPCSLPNPPSSIVGWGANNNGLLDVPPPNTGFISLGGGYYHILALKSNNSIVAWGENGYGQCNVPAPNTGFLAASGGRYHSIGLGSV